MVAVNPRVDIAFKKIFGVDENKDLLISLINSIVSEEDQVVDVTLLNPYNQQNFKEEKFSILDIKAVGCHGKRFNIEIQISDEGSYHKRALYYWAKVYTDQIKKSEPYSKLNKVIGIHILNFTSVFESEKYHNVFHITEKETNLPCFGDLELHTVELKKFTDNLGEEFEAIASKIHTSLDMWSAFLTKFDYLIPEKLVDKPNNSELKKAMDVLKVMNFSEKEREAYEGHLDWLRIQTDTISNLESKLGKKKALELIALGRQRKEIRKEGLEEGRQIEKTAIALALLKQCLDISQIAEATGLSPEEIAQLEVASPPPPSPE